MRTKEEGKRKKEKEKKPSRLFVTNNMDSKIIGIRLFAEHFLLKIRTIII